MTLHRKINITLVAIGLMCVWFLAMDSDYRADADSSLRQEQREWMQAVQFCHKTAGPQTQPEYSDDGKLICVGKRGQKHQVML